MKIPVLTLLSFFLNISCQYAYSEHEFDGSIDESRISSNIRSANWIKAQYDSMNDAFIAFESEE